MLKIIELFAGVGSQTQALKNLGIPHEVVAISEIDKYAIDVYQQLHGEANNLGDISKIQRLPEADLWTYSFPCQDLSLAGNLKGIKKGTRSGLLLEVERLLDVSAFLGQLPKYLILENVRNLVTKRFKPDFDKWLQKLESLGYTNYWQVLNAKDYGVPQNRERVFTVSIRKDIDNGNFKFPEKQELKLKLKDLLEDKVDEKYYLSNTGVEYFKKQAEERNENLEHYKEKKMLKVAHGYNKGSIINLDISPTLDCNFSTYWRGVLLEPKIYIKNATKKGYIEAFEGDSVNLSYPESETRRGRVGNQVSQTLQCNDMMGVVVSERKKSNCK